jgi:hypothetical protein
MIIVIPTAVPKRINQLSAAAQTKCVAELFLKYETAIKLGMIW